MVEEDKTAILMIYPLDADVIRAAARCAARQVVLGKLSAADLRVVLGALGITADQLRT